MVLAVCGVQILLAGVAGAQTQNQFGGQDRADATTRLVVIAVQRALATLPPSSGQSVTYEYDPATDALQRSTRLGPTALRSAQTVGPGTLSLQAGVSYFEMAQTFGPIDYLLTFNSPSRGQGVAKIGLGASARVTAFNLSATYGLSRYVDLGVALPVVAVDTHGSEIFSTRTNALSLPANQAPLSGVSIPLNGNVTDARNALNMLLQPGGPLSLRKETFRSLGVNFNDGTNAGVGRIDLSGKGVLLARESFQIASLVECFLPSPSEAEFAGPASAAIAPRLIATLKLADAIRLHSDVGYDYDFDSAALRQFMWSIGGAVTSERAELDLGVGGSEFNAPVQWTPTHITGTGVTGQALEDNTAGDLFVDVLLGLKLRLTDSTVIAGAVTIPVVNTAFQPDVLGTLAVEYNFGL
ncbi:MAG: hypothetical protein ACHQ9S_17550 [Candidatus Binatia bacterium]